MRRDNKKILWRLFREYLLRKEKESKASYNSYNYNYSSNGGWFNGVIYFYEWSDPERKPLMFYNITTFDNFLKRSNIFIPTFQRDMIYNLDRSHITCKKGKTELLIRGTLEALKAAISVRNAPGVSINDLPKKEDNKQNLPMVLPYNVQCCFPPNSNNNVPRMAPYRGNPEEWYG